MKALTPFALLALAATLIAPRGAGSEPVPSVSPVVLELFTSQGCSSCPPADRLLTQLGADPRLAGQVIPLSFHVDYWNSIGWRDPFSSAEWSERQNRYSEAFRLGRIYTPQVVINGHGECLGSDEREVRRRIDEAARVPPAGQVALRLEPGGSRVKVGVNASLATKPERGLEVWVALYETSLSTSVSRGENARRTLRNDYVVRRLVRAFTLPAAPGSRSGEVALAIDPAWKRADLGVVAFLQDPVTLAIRGAASQRLR